MPDVHDVVTRSRNMAAIRGANTKPELLVRKRLHAKGFRFRLNVRRLSGTPDLVFARHNAAIFVHGCFWHGHDCRLFRLPKTRKSIWKAKIASNQVRDAKVIRELFVQGWRVGVIFECALKGPDRLPESVFAQRCSSWLQGTAKQMLLRGKPVRTRSRLPDRRRTKPSKAYSLKSVNSAKSD